MSNITIPLSVLLQASAALKEAQSKMPEDFNEAMGRRMRAAEACGRLDYHVKRLTEQVAVEVSKSEVAS